MSTTPMSVQQRVVTRRLTIRYIVALGIIALMTILAQIGVQVTIQQQTSDARVINIAALQRTLSERLSKDAVAIVQTPDVAIQGTYIAELRAVVPQWEHTHLALQTGDPTMGLPGHNSPPVAQLFAEIAPSFGVMQDAATQILIIVDSQPPVPLPSAPTLNTLVAPYVPKILDAEPSFVTGMDAIISQYQLEAEQRISRLQVLEWTLLAVILTVVMILWMTVFRPATQHVGQSIGDLVRAQQREHELAALKDQFIIDANHELRTPIMALYNNLEVLAAFGETAPPERRTRVIQRALAAGDAVLRLLTRVLDTSALEGKPPRLDFKPVALAPLVREVLETFDPREIGEPATQSSGYAARPVEMHIAPDVSVWADEGRLRQILVNLLGNALKYSGPGTPISVSAAPYVESSVEPRRAREKDAAPTADAGQVQIRVRDRGLGVPQRDIPNLFNRFVRLERDIAGPVRGTGVGLYLCRVLVEAMGGRIWVESSGIAGEGSTFAFLLPAPPPPAYFPSTTPAEALHTTA